MLNLNIKYSEVKGKRGDFGGDNLEQVEVAKGVILQDLTEIICYILYVVRGEDSKHCNGSFKAKDEGDERKVMMIQVSNREEKV